MNRARIGIYCGMAVVAGLLVGGINLFWGELNQDEGWYLYAAARTAEGARPYADYAFTQGPVFTAVYAQVFRVWPEAGLQAGRVFTALLGWVSLALAVALAWRLTPSPWRSAVAVGVVALLGCNVYHNYFTLIVKTYALTAVLLTGGAYALTFLKPGRSRGPALIAGGLLALAAGVRLSAGVWLPWVALMLALGPDRRARSGYWFTGGALLGLAWAFGPSLWRAPAETWFWLGPFHAARDAGSLTAAGLFKAGFGARWLQAYYPLALLGIIWVGGASTGGPRWWKVPRPAGILWGGIALMTLVHLAAPFPYDDYQVPLMPVFAALLLSGVGHWLAGLVSETRQSAWAHTVAVAWLVIGLTGAVASPRTQDWFIRGRDRIWWPTKAQSDLGLLQATAQYLARYTEPGDTLLTQDTYLAVEAGLRVPPGLNLGPFSYFPDWSTADAQRRHVVNRPLLEALLEAGTAEWAAVSGYGLAIAGPGVTPVPDAEREQLLALIEENYVLHQRIPYFGQAHTTLKLYRRKDRAHEE